MVDVAVVSEQDFGKLIVAGSATRPEKLSGLAADAVSPGCGYALRYEVTDVSQLAASVAPDGGMISVGGDDALRFASPFDSRLGFGLTSDTLGAYVGGDNNRSSGSKTMERNGCMIHVDAGGPSEVGDLVADNCGAASRNGDAQRLGTASRTKGAQKSMVGPGLLAIPGRDVGDELEELPDGKVEDDVKLYFMWGCRGHRNRRSTGIFLPIKEYECRKTNFGYLCWVRSKPTAVTRIPIDAKSEHK
jgi:hypothetical protein